MKSSSSGVGLVAAMGRFENASIDFRQSNHWLVALLVLVALTLTVSMIPFSRTHYHCLRRRQVQRLGCNSHAGEKSGSLGNHLQNSILPIIASAGWHDRF
jgi:hypothetical protein